MMFYFTASAASASALVLCTVPSGWLRGEQIVYSFNSSVFDVLITLWYVPAGATTASPSRTVCSSFSFRTNFACPFSMRKNWSTCGCTSSPMSSPGRRHITTSCECGPVNSTCRKYLFSEVCFSIGPTYPVIVLVSFRSLMVLPAFVLALHRFAAASIFHVLGDEVPVRQLPEGLDVLGPRVAAVDVVGMFPNVAGQQGLVLGRQRRAGVAGRAQFESSVRRLNEPCPAGAEQAGGGFGELFLELLEGPEVLLDALEQRAGRFARGTRAEAAPVEGVVPDLGGVVEDFALGGAHDVLKRQVLVLGAGNELVQVVHVGLMVLAVVVFDGLGGDVRAQRALDEWQWRKLDHSGALIKCHVRLSASSGPNAISEAELSCSSCGAQGGGQVSRAALD